MSAHVFCQSLLRRAADIKTAEIDSYGEGNAFFQTVRNGLHETPHGLTQNGLVGVGGGNDSDIIRLSWPDLARNPDACRLPGNG